MYTPDPLSAAAYRASRDASTRQTVSCGPSGGTIGFQVAESHTRTSESCPAVATRLPSADTATASTHDLCPFRSATSAPVFASQTTCRLSRPADSTCRPPLTNLTADTSDHLNPVLVPSCFRTDSRSLPDGRSNTLTVPSAIPTATADPSSATSVDCRDPWRTPTGTNTGSDTVSFSTSHTTTACSAFESTRTTTALPPRAK
jgi:hypothetical protein